MELSSESPVNLIDLKVLVENPKRCGMKLEDSDLLRRFMAFPAGLLLQELVVWPTTEARASALGSGGSWLSL